MVENSFSCCCGGCTGYTHQSDTFKAEENRKDRHKHDIQRGDESRLADGGVDDGVLLDKRCAGKCDTAQKSGDQQRTAVFTRRFLIGAAAFFTGVERGDDRQKHDRADNKAYRVECQRPDVVHALTLGNECAAPDQRGQDKHRRTDKISFFHKTPHLR